MNQRVAPAASLTPVAEPVSRYVTPVYQYAPSTNGWLQAAEALQTLNPSLNRFLDNRYNDLALQSEAEGQLAEQQIDASVQFGQGRDAWRTFVENVRSSNPEAAVGLEGANPHFRRGLIRNRMNRIGMGLGDYLQQQYLSNAGGVQGMSEADIQSWAMGQINARSQELGIAQMDPVLLAEVFLPHTERASRSMVGYVGKVRSRAAKRDYESELSAGIGMILTGGDTGESPPSIFLDQINGANWVAGDNPPKLSFSGLQEVDEALATSGLTSLGYPTDGLRTVAAEEGIGPVLSWGSLGAPVDAPIAERVRQASSPAPRIQSMLDNAIADGMNPRKANEVVVDSVITAAMESGNLEVLNALDEVRTPFGPLSSIQRHRQDILNAQFKIEDRQWRIEERELKTEEREEEERKDALDTDATRAIIADPFDPAIDEIADRALEQGYPDLARQIRAARERAIDGEFNVRTNHGVVADLRVRLSNNSITPEQFRREVQQGVGVDFPSSVALSLMDDLDNRERFEDAFGDRQVQSVISDFERVVSERFTRDGILERIPGTEASIKARFEFEANVTDFVRENPEASITEVRAYAREEASRLLSSDQWQPTEQEIDSGQNRGFDTQDTASQEEASASPPPVPPSDAAVVASTIQQLPTWLRDLGENPDGGLPEGAAEAINATAAALGITAQELIAQYGAQQ